MVDLQGRLTNPPYNFGRAADRLPAILARAVRRDKAAAKPQEQRRLTPAAVDDLVALYGTGLNVGQVAAAFGVNRETALLHLRRRGVPSRAKVRKLTDETLATAMRRYVAGEPMTSLCADLGVNPTTLRRELAASGTPLRRPGRPAITSGDVESLKRHRSEALPR